MMPSTPTQPRLIALAGPTASGKTEAALALAAQCDVEIISVDSALVYRGMNIGTAKPSELQRAAVPHHLIDIRDTDHPYNAAEFTQDATRLVREINARGRLAVLVGGTMLYFKAFFEGLNEMPAADPAIRAQINAQAAEQGWLAMHALLAEVDPAMAARLAPGDTQRVQRALEVFRASGRPLSEFHAAGAASGCALQPALFVSLEPQNRGWLHERIARRFDAMLEAGFIQEVQALRARGDLHAGSPSMRCVGYRQAWEALDGQLPMNELRERGIFATRQLAKRQLTWLRGMKERQVILCDASDAVDQWLRLALPVAT